MLTVPMRSPEDLDTWTRLVRYAVRLAFVDGLQFDRQAASVE